MKQDDLHADKYQELLKQLDTLIEQSNLDPDEEILKLIRSGRKPQIVRSRNATRRVVAIAAVLTAVCVTLLLSVTWLCRLSLLSLLVGIPSLWVTLSGLFDLVLFVMMRRSTSSSERYADLLLRRKVRRYWLLSLIVVLPAAEGASSHPTFGSCSLAKVVQSVRWKRLATVAASVLLLVIGFRHVEYPHDPAPVLSASQKRVLVPPAPKHCEPMVNTKTQKHDDIAMLPAPPLLEIADNEGCDEEPVPTCSDFPDNDDQIFHNESYQESSEAKAYVRCNRYCESDTIRALCKKIV